MGILKNFDIFNYLGVAVICIAADEFKIIKINEEAELITGYQEQELLNQNIFNIFSDHQKRIIDSILSLDTKKPCREKNLVLRRKTGRFVDVSISVMSHKDSNIKIITITDETMIKKAEWEIADLRSMMLQNAKLAAIGEVSAGIAHEVNNPLAIIIGLCDNLLERVSDENVREEILKITKTTERVSKIIRGLKEISRDDSTEPLVSVSLFDLISDSMWLVLDKIKSNNIQFNIKDFTNKAFVECNPSMLSQAIFNLIHNAIDAIKDLDEKWIYLKIQENKDNIQLIVEDSGNGISPEKTEKIFMPFYSTKLSSGGTGLGLSLAKKVIENCGGKIKYNSKAVNTTFEVYLNKSETQQNNYVCKEEVLRLLDLMMIYYLKI